MSAAASAAISAAEQKATLRGLGLLVLALIILPGQDAVAKLISATVSPGQISWARFLLQTLFTLPLLVWLEGWGAVVPNRLWSNVLRGGLIAVSSMLFFASIRYMPLADALAIFFIEPFALTVLSAVIDKEHVDRSRRIAVGMGFLGVLIVVQPSYAVFGSVSLLPAAAGFIFAVYALLNRRCSAYDSALTMQLTAGVSAWIILSIGLAAGWLLGIAELTPSLPDGREAGWLLLMGILGTTGHFLFVQASRLAPPSLIAPLQYVEIAAAALLGYLVFGDFPNAWQWVGIAIIVGSGAFVFWGVRQAR